MTPIFYNKRITLSIIFNEAMLHSVYNLIRYDIYCEQKSKGISTAHTEYQSGASSFSWY